MRTDHRHAITHTNTVYIPTHAVRYCGLLIPYILDQVEWRETLNRTNCYRICYKRTDFVFYGNKIISNTHFAYSHSIECGGRYSINSRIVVVDNALPDQMRRSPAHKSIEMRYRDTWNISRFGIVVIGSIRVARFVWGAIKLLMFAFAQIWVLYIEFPVSNMDFSLKNHILSRKRFKWRLFSQFWSDFGKEGVVGDVLESTIQFRNKIWQIGTYG